MHDMSIPEQFKKITTLVFDIDGVLTDGGLLILEDGQQARQMNIKDGYALQLAVKKGYHVICISGAINKAVAVRLNKLGVEEIYMGVENKLGTLGKFLELKNIPVSQVMYMGDDMPDYEVMRSVELPCCPLDAAIDIKNISRYISPYKGGEGCVRDVIEKILKHRGDWLDTSSTRSI